MGKSLVEKKNEGAKGSSPIAIAVDKDITRRVKRQPPRPHTKPEDVYVTTRSSFPGQLKRVNKMLLREAYNHVVIHGMGKAIERAIELALAVEASMRGQITLDVATKSVDLVDDLIPEDENKDISTQGRTNSAVTITIRLGPSLLLT